MEVMTNPSDRDSLRKKYEAKTPREGTCGPTVIALLVGKKVEAVISNWSIPYRGYCSFGELERELNKYDIETEKVKTIEDYKLPEGVDHAIARIQWKKKLYRIPEKNTHFVYIGKKKSVIYDSDIGWSKIGSKIANTYAKNGKVTSLICIKDIYGRETSEK